MSADLTDPAQSNQEALAAWETKANFWDTLMGEDGNVFHRTLLRPAIERLLDVQPGMHVLDVACGTGLVARAVGRPRRDCHRL